MENLIQILQPFVNAFSELLIKITKIRFRFETPNDPFIISQISYLYAHFKKSRRIVQNPMLHNGVQNSVLHNGVPDPDSLELDFESFTVPQDVEA